MKRFLSILLAVVMIMSMAVPAFAFTDIEDSDYAEAITYLTGLNVIAGYDDGTFKPEKVVTRAEMAKLLVVCLGLEPGAALLEGTTSFDDVPATHWATGYIAVATQYGLIKGDGDGNFRPDDTVNVAEAATMILRALGYNRVVDKTGEWPTNYLNKANELRVFEDVETFKGTDGATRGMIAQMMWNMMNIRMWDVNEESEGDGLTYGKASTMLATKFPDYDYVQNATINSIEIEKDKDEYKVSVKFDDALYSDTLHKYVSASFEYEENDFYKLLKDTSVNLLWHYGKKTSTLVAMFVDDDEVLVEGNLYDLKEDYTKVNVAKGSYGWLLLSDDREDATIEHAAYAKVGANKVVTEVKETSKNTKVYFDGSTTATYIFADEDEAMMKYGLILKDGERVSVSALEEGDVLTVVTNDGFSFEGFNGAVNDIGVVTDKTATGTFDGLSVETTKDDYVATLEVGGEEYDVRSNFFGAYTIDDEDEPTLWNDVDKDDLKIKEKDNDYVGEDCTVYFDAFGGVAAIVFGDITETADEGNFFVVVNSNPWVVADEDGETQYVKLANEDGTKSYVVDEDCEMTDLSKAGNIVWVSFDKDDEIEIVKLVGKVDLATVEDHDPQPVDNDPIKGIEFKTIIKDTTANNDYEDVYQQAIRPTSSLEKDDNNYFDETYKITSSTVVFKLSQVLDEDENFEDKVLVETSTGSEELKNVPVNQILLVREKGQNTKVAYAFVLGDTESDDMFGVVEAMSTKLGVDYITIGEEKYELAKDSLTTAVGEVVRYSLIDGGDTAKVKASFDVSDLTNEYKVIKVKDELVSLDDDNDGDEDKEIDLELLRANEGDYEDYDVYMVTVDYDGDTAFVDTLEQIELEDVKMSKDQYIDTYVVGTTIKVLFIVDGYVEEN